MDNIGSDLLLLNRDLSSNDMGDISLISGDQHIVQTAISNLLTIYGELENNPTRGNMIYNRRIKLNTTGMAQVKADCIRALSVDTRVEVMDVVVTQSDTPSVCDIQFQLKRVDNGRILDSGISISIMEV